MNKETEKTREVYIGNGQTIQAVIDQEYVNYLDLDKLEKVLKESLDKKVWVGATGDWFWTSTDINLDDLEKIKKGEEYLLLSSDWSRFHCEIDDKKIDLTFRVPRSFSYVAKMAGFIQGLNSGKFRKEEKK